MMNFTNQTYDEERALYGIHDAIVTNCTFDGPADGESALKETNNLLVERCHFNLRYPFWHCNNSVIREVTMTEGCRAGQWYGDGLASEDRGLIDIYRRSECHTIRLHGYRSVSPG